MPSCAQLQYSLVLGGTFPFHVEELKVDHAQDRFTTNYYLPDGSYGSITSGNYTTIAGDHANLITGIYQLANGNTGNIYEGDTIDEPNTSTLPLPTPFTSKGVGSAIPATAVGTSPMPPWPALTFSTVPGSNAGNMTTPGGSTARTPSAINTGGTLPEITPPVTNGATGYVRRGLYRCLTMAFFVACTGLLTY